MPLCLCEACKWVQGLEGFMYNCVCYYEHHVRKGKILFPWFLKCEKKVELSGHEAKTQIVIYNLSGVGLPSVDTYLALFAREELE